jgi:hypothetical protein
VHIVRGSTPDNVLHELAAASEGSVQSRLSIRASFLVNEIEVLL